MNRSLPGRQGKEEELPRQQTWPEGHDLTWPDACGTGVQKGLWSSVHKGALKAQTLSYSDQEPTDGF